MNDILTPVNAAKFMCLVLAAHGVVHALAPAPTAAKYSFPSNEDGRYSKVIKTVGCAMLFTSSIAWCLISQEGMDRYLAYAVGTTFWFAINLAAALNKEGAHVGGSDVPHVVNASVMLVMIQGFQNQDWAPWVAKFGVADLWFHGLGYTFASKWLMCKIYLCQEENFDDAKHDPFMNLMVRGSGITMLQSAVLSTALELNVQPISAFGLSCAFLAMGLYLLPFDNNAAEITFTTRHLLMATGCALMSFFMLREGIKTNEAAEDVVSAT